MNCDKSENQTIVVLAVLSEELWESPNNNIKGMLDDVVTQCCPWSHGKHHKNNLEGIQG